MSFQADDDVAKIIWSLPLDKQMLLMAMIIATTNVLAVKPIWYQQWINRQGVHAPLLTAMVKSIVEG